MIEPESSCQRGRAVRIRIPSSLQTLCVLGIGVEKIDRALYVQTWLLVRKDKRCELMQLRKIVKKCSPKFNDLTPACGNLIVRLLILVS